MPQSRSNGYRVLISAGPTHEPIDAVRYIANRSSGRTGLAFAAAAIRRRLPTTLLLGPTHLHPPQGSHLRTIRFQTTADLQDLLTARWPEHDLLIMAAAVADYRPAGPAETGKLHRGAGPLSLALEPTPDLLAGLSAITRPGQTRIGFALGPADGLLEGARKKLADKDLDAIIANPLETIGAEQITATLVLRDGKVLTPPAAITKDDFADWVFDRFLS